MNRRTWRRLRAPFEAALLRTAAGTVSLCSYAGIRRLAAAGALLSGLDRRHRRLVMENLQIAFPDWDVAQRRAAAREVARSTVLTALEFLWFSHHPQPMTDLVELTDDSGRDLVAAAHERGPAIYVTPHLGNWEIMAQAVARHGVRIHAVAQRVRNPLIAEFVDRTRRVYGLDLLSSRGAAKGLVRALRQGDAVAILMDQNVRPRHGGVFVDFFGLPVPTSRAPASLARRLQVPILCFACLRTPTGFRLREERLPKPTAAYTDDLELTQDLMRTMERLVRQAPTQYMWGYERWRYLPPDCDAQTLDRFPAYAEHG